MSRTPVCRRLSRILAATLAAGSVALVASQVPAAVAGAATQSVTNCSGDSTVSGSLPYVVANAAAGDLITFNIGVACPTITLTTGVMDINQNLTITGPGASVLAVSGGGTSGIFNISNGAVVSMSGLTFENGNGGGNPYGDGGAIDVGDNGSTGTLTVNASTFSNNSSTGIYGGGAIDSGNYLGTATLTVNASTFSNNSATGLIGGAIASGNYDGTSTLTVNASTFTGNSAASGGAIDSGRFGVGTLTVNASTFSKNSATEEGGAIDSGANGGHATLTVNAATFTGNSAASGGAIDNAYGGNATLTVNTSTFTGNSAINGGAIDNGDNSGTGTASLSADILAANTTGECFGVFTDGGYNISDADHRPQGRQSRSRVHPRRHRESVPDDRPAGRHDRCRPELFRRVLSAGVHSGFQLQ